MNDNTTTLSAGEYDKKVNHTIPYFDEFYSQTFGVIENINPNPVNWLDLGCGTGSMEQKAVQLFPGVQFVMLDPSEQMLDQARAKNADIGAEYICAKSFDIAYDNAFDVVTAIQAHHYMHEDERTAATEKVYRALRDGGIYITFENTLPESAEIRDLELRRWGKYQLRHGKSEEEVKVQTARCGVNYFPLTIKQHVALLNSVGFKAVHLFWYSYMQMGLYAIK